MGLRLSPASITACQSSLMVWFPLTSFLPELTDVDGAFVRKLHHTRADNKTGVFLRSGRIHFLRVRVYSSRNDWTRTVEPQIPPLSFYVCT